MNLTDILYYAMISFILLIFFYSLYNAVLMYVEMRNNNKKLLKDLKELLRLRQELLAMNKMLKDKYGEK